MPRFDQSFNGLCEQNLQETQQLKQRYLDGKNKRVPKTKDKKQQDSIQSSVHVQQKFLKRSVEEHDPGGGGTATDGYEPPVKLQCTTQHGSHQPEGLTKFSVEIVQQLEFTTSAANSQPQQISTNVTVKAHTNASVKSDVASPKSSNPPTPAKTTASNIVSGVDVGTLVECVKQEPDNDFADLDQCAAALEKDAVAHGGAGFGVFTDLIGDDTNDDTLKDLISDITNCPEFMNEFDFEGKTDVVNALKVEDLKDISSSLDAANNIHSPLMQNQNYSPPVFENKNRLPYSNMDFAKTELSPAAQTLKQMAEQHQHKNQMGLSYNPNGRAPNSRSPYPDFQIPDYGSPNSNISNSQFHKGNSTFPQADIIKQEMMFQGADFDMKRKGASGMYKQQYSPYGSPSASSHGSPGYLPRGNTGGNSGPNSNNFGAGTPPRPPSGPGGNNSSTTLQINQAQQLHISQQAHGHNIQVSAGQHLHLTGDLKGNVSIAAQQGMHFSHVSSATNSNQQQSQQSQSQQQNAHQQSQNNASQQTNQHNPGQQNQQNQQQQSQQQHQQNGPGQHSNTMLSGNQHPNLQTSLGSMGNSNIPSGMTSNMSPGIGTSMHSPGLSNIPSSNNMAGNGLGGSGGLQSGLGGNTGLGGGNTMMGPGGMGSHGVLPGNHLSGQTGLGDSYSLTQSQTINFTQQTLRQRANGTNGIPNNMGPANQFGPGGPMAANNMNARHLSPQALEHQKLLQQQQMLRAQQAAVQQHVRPPPPDYKTTAGMMQGMQPRYSGVPPNVRRCLQPMPPSGPMMMRPHNMYMMQQQHMNARAVYPRQQTSMNSMDNIPPQSGNTEWRHMLMSQQQTANFTQQMRPNFQPGFNMNTGNIPMTALQHQQLRVQQGLVGNSMGQGLGQGMSQGQVMNQGSPMSQMNTLNQQIMTHMQQQQSVMQQNSNQMSMSTIHMQQSQSVSMSGQGLQQQQQQNVNNQLVNAAASGGMNQPNLMNSFNTQTADFSLEFLDNLPTGDTGGFTEQELLSSFDNDSGFNLQDILDFLENTIDQLLTGIIKSYNQYP